MNFNIAHKIKIEKNEMRLQLVNTLKRMRPLRESYMHSRATDGKVLEQYLYESNRIGAVMQELTPPGNDYFVPLIDVINSDLDLYKWDPLQHGQWYSSNSGSLASQWILRVITPILGDNIESIDDVYHCLQGAKMILRMSLDANNSDPNNVTLPSYGGLDFDGNRAVLAQMIGATVDSVNENRTTVTLGRKMFTWDDRLFGRAFSLGFANVEFEASPYIQFPATVSGKAIQVTQKGMTKDNFNMVSISRNASSPVARSRAIDARDSFIEDFNAAKNKFDISLLEANELTKVNSVHKLVLSRVCPMGLAVFSAIMDETPETFKNILRPLANSLSKIDSSSLGSSDTLKFITNMFDVLPLFTRLVIVSMKDAKCLDSEYSNDEFN